MDLRDAEPVMRIRFMRRSARARGRRLAALLRWGTGRFDLGARPAVTGNTVVSKASTAGGRDLRFGAAPVLLTAGFPALSPMMGLTTGARHRRHRGGQRPCRGLATRAFNLDEYVDRLTLRWVIARRLNRWPKFCI